MAQHGYYIVDTEGYRGAVEGPFFDVDQADRTLAAYPDKYDGVGHANYQVIDGAYLTDYAFAPYREGAVRRAPPRGGIVLENPLGTGLILAIVAGSAAVVGGIVYLATKSSTPAVAAPVAAAVPPVVAGATLPPAAVAVASAQTGQAPSLVHINPNLVATPAPTGPNALTTGHGYTLTVTTAGPQEPSAAQSFAQQYLTPISGINVLSATVPSANANTMVIVFSYTGPGTTLVAPPDTAISLQDNGG